MKLPDNEVFLKTDTPMHVTVSSTERVMRRGRYMLLLDRAWTEGDRVFIPAMSSFNVRPGLSGDVSGIFDTIWSGVTSAWNWVTGAGYDKSVWGVVVMPDGKEYQVKPDDPNIIVRDGGYWYNTGASVQTIKLNPSYTGTGMTASTPSSLTNTSLNVTGYNDIFSMDSGNTGVLTSAAETNAALAPSQQAGSGINWNSVLSSVAQNLKYDPSTGAVSYGNTPTPGSIASTNPGSMSANTQGNQAYDAFSQFSEGVAKSAPLLLTGAGVLGILLVASMVAKNMRTA